MIVQLQSFPINSQVPPLLFDSCPMCMDLHLQGFTLLLSEGMELVYILGCWLLLNRILFFKLKLENFKVLICDAYLFVGVSTKWVCPHFSPYVWVFRNTK